MTDAERAKRYRANLSPEALPAKPPAPSRRRWGSWTCPMCGSIFFGRKTSEGHLIVAHGLEPTPELLAHAREPLA